MQIAVLADIHGNRWALAAARQAARLGREDWAAWLRSGRASR